MCSKNELKFIKCMTCGLEHDARHPFNWKVGDKCSDCGKPIGNNRRKMLMLRIKNELKNHAPTRIMPNGERLKYLINFQFILNDFKEYSEEAQSETDWLEREHLLNLAHESIEYFEEDILTRKACFCNVKVGGHGNTKKDFGNCIVMVHLYVLNNKLEMNIYVRSQRFPGNFAYDLNTFTMILNVVAKKMDMASRKINVWVGNLHAEEKAVV